MMPMPLNTARALRHLFQRELAAHDDTITELSARRASPALTVYLAQLNAERAQFATGLSELEADNPGI